MYLFTRFSPCFSSWLCVESDQNTKIRCGLAGLIAVVVGILDEYNQSFIPARDASGGDVLLDIAGVLLVLLLAFRFPPSLWGRFLKKFKI